MYKKGNTKKTQAKSMVVILDWSVSLRYVIKFSDSLFCLWVEVCIGLIRILVAIYLCCDFVEHTLLSQFLPTQESNWS